VFQTLVDRFNGKTNVGSTSVDEVFDDLASILIGMFGSIFVGLACGCGAWVYFFLLGRDLPPVMEVGSFFLWALIPWYIADGLHMSGIVSIVAVAFFMDIYIAGPKDQSRNGPPKQPKLDYCTDDYMNMQDHPAQSMSSFESTGRSVGPLPSTERLHLSSVADRHVRFVAHLTAQLAENAIFAYLGLFLFSNNYDWDPTLVTISIFSCVASRAFMVLVVSWFILHIYKCRGMAGGSVSNSSKTAVAISDPRTQAVLVLAGLRGAVSLALVENVPIYNQQTGEGCEFKQLMKGMTSASILFTTFVFGGGAYYILPGLGITRDEESVKKSDETPAYGNEAELSVPDAVLA
jgi:NhaP-type Na+/H+ or K+/H+ antiporter